MTHLCYKDICTIISALRALAMHKEELAEVLKDGHTKESVLREREDILRLHDYFRDIADRLLDIDLGQSVRITAKFNK